MPANPREWPELPLPSWRNTCETLHMWTQIVGKVRLALAPAVNHWWHVPLYLTARGLTTSPMPYRGDAVEIAFDFVDHRLRIEKSDGTAADIALVPQTVADFYRAFLSALHTLQIDVRIWPMPVEVPNPIRFDLDTVHASYDREFAHGWWRALLTVDAILKQFRGRFLGKCSPVQFFWGSFDLAVTRFNGRRAPARPGADRITQVAYSHDVISAGFWPGGGVVDDAAFYAYAAPEPAGFRTASIRPAEAAYNSDLGEYILMYETVRRSADPAAALLDFLQSTYEAGATAAGWNRAELERSMEVS